MTLASSKRRGLIAAGLIAGTGAAAALAWQWQGRSGLARVRRQGLLRIGYAVEPPYAMRDAQGRVIGEAPAVARLVAAQLGLERSQWLERPFSALIAGLLARDYDLIAAGMFVTPERARQVLFSDPSLRVLPGLLVDAGNPRNLRSEADLRDQGELRVLALRASVEAARLGQLGLSEPRLQLVDSLAAALEALREGRAQAFCLSLPAVRMLAAAHPQFQALRLRQEAGGKALGYTAFQFHPEDRSLQQAWIAAQAGLMGSPAHLAAIAPYGFGSDDLPGAVRSRHLIEEA